MQKDLIDEGTKISKKKGTEVPFSTI